MLEEPVKCGNPRIVETMNHRERAISKGWIQPIRRDGAVFCGWCNERELPAGRQKYCSDDCAITSSAWCSPNTDSNAFHWLLKRQDFKCEICSHDWMPAFQYQKQIELRSIRRMCYFHFNQRRTQPSWNEYTIPALRTEIEAYWEAKREATTFNWRTPDNIRAYHRNLKDNHEPETDHIIPVALGGMAVGFDNVQLICRGCHSAKTRKDNQEIRELRNSERKKMFEDNF